MNTLVTHEYTGMHAQKHYVYTFFNHLFFLYLGEALLGGRALRRESLPHAQPPLLGLLVNLWDVRVRETIH